MVQVKTNSGFVIEFDEARADNMEFLDALTDADENIANAGRAIALLLGKEGRAALYDHVRAEDGRVPINAVASEFLEILEKAELKN